jgi:peptidoglycan/xylan/chitin deacetylase (PgdA/CDA1 family)
VYSVNRPKNISPRLLTIDLEDYFQANVMSGAVPSRYWPRLERRLDMTANAWIDALAQSCSGATIFVSPWALQMHPGAVRAIAAAGHEVAALGLFDSPTIQNDATLFLAHVRSLKSALEAICGHQVAGFRLARGAMTSTHLQAVADAGYLYDSSEHASRSRMPPNLVYVTPLAPQPAMRDSTVFARAWSSLTASNSRGITPGPVSALRYLAPSLDPAQPRITALSALQQRRHYHELFRRAARLTSELAETPSSSIARGLNIRLETVAIVPPAAAPTSLSSTTTAAVDARAQRLPITLVVPCCNEAGTIAYLANTLARFEAGAASAYRVHYVFVDDGSTDETFAELRQFFGANPDAQIIRHDGNKGVAAATMTGVTHAPTEFVGVIDCDCSYDPAEVMRMVPLMQAGTALVTASPYHPDGHVVNVPVWRLWLSRRLSQLYRVTLKTPLHTYTACVRLYRKSALEGLTIRHGNYLGIAEILARLDQSGARIVESPAVLEARILGHSKMKIVRTSFGHIGLLAELMMARVLRRTKKQLGFAHE